MSYITLLSGKEGRTAMKGGMTKLHDAVKSSMGPAGRNMYLEFKDNPAFTKDGATIAKWIQSSRLIDAYERAGAAIMRRPSMKTEEEAGDGTTSATVLSYAMMIAAEKYVDAGVNVLGIERGMRKAYERVHQYLKDETREAKDESDWEKVAYISSRDKEVAEMIKDAMKKVGPTGYIRVEPGDDWREHEMSLEVKEGMTWPRGFASESAINDRAKIKCTLKNAPVLVTNLELFTEKDAILLGGIADALFKLGHKSMVIIGRKFAGRVTDLILQNNEIYHKKGGASSGEMLILPVEAPGLDTIFTHEFCEDIAVITSAKLISTTNGTLLDHVPIDQNIMKFVGMCDVVESTKKETNIVSSKADKQMIEQRIAEVKALHENEKGELNKRHYEERLAKLGGGMAIITVGGRHTENIGEKTARVTDAVLATKCAFEEGIVPGGGITLLRAGKVLKDLEGEDYAEQCGIAVVREALSAPLRVIARNCCIDEQTAEKIGTELPSPDTFNMHRGTLDVVDAFDDGVIDPVKVVRSSLLNAIEGAIGYFTTETVGVGVPENKNGDPLWEIVRGDALEMRKKEEKPEVSGFYGGDIVPAADTWKPRRLGALLRWLW